MSNLLQRLRCSLCLRRRYAILSSDWPVCCGEVMEPEPKWTRIGRTWRRVIPLVIGYGVLQMFCSGGGARPAMAEDLSRPLVIYGVVGGADYASTRLALSRGRMEANPIVNAVGLEASKILQAALLVALDLELQRRDPGKVKILRGLVIGVGMVVVIHNLKAGWK